MWGIIFNVAGLKGHKGPWEDIRVRRAMQLTADYPGSIIAAQGSLELAMNSGIVPPYVETGLSWEECSKIIGIDKPMKERVAEAKKLLKEAGVPDGFTVEMATRTTSAYHKAAAYLMQGWRERLGITINMKTLHNAVYFPKRDASDFDIIYEGMPGRYGGAPEETLSMFVTGVTSNYGGWANAEYNNLYNQLVRETDREKREEMSTRMQKIFLEDVPFIINVSVKEGVADLPTVHGHHVQTAHTTWAQLDHIWLDE
jgi:ABC-type transport system substrate-binding protein